jgi:hypothetical protein
MNIKYKEFLLFFVNAPQSLPDNGIREESEVAATAYWEVGAGHLHRRDWKFNYEL